MGEIADMILNGILDEETGEFIDDELSMNGASGLRKNTMTALALSGSET